MKIIFFLIYLISTALAYSSALDNSKTCVDTKERIKNNIENTLSPNGKYAIYVQNTVGIIDVKTSKKLCEIIDQFANAYITAFWNNNSTILVIIEQFGRTADIFIAKLTKDGTWNSNRLKFSETIIPFYNKQDIDYVNSEEYEFAEWISDNEFKIYCTANTTVKDSLKISKRKILFEFTVKITDKKINILNMHLLNK